MTDKPAWEIEQERRRKSENMFATCAFSLFAAIAIAVIVLAGLLLFAFIKLFIWPCIVSVWGMM